MAHPTSSEALVRITGAELRAADQRALRGGVPTRVVSVMGATRIGKSTLLNGLVSKAAGRTLTPFAVGASESAVTQGIDVFSNLETGGVAFLDVEGIGAHGASYDARLLALPIVVSDVIVYCTQLKPAAVSKIREQLYHHVVTAHSLLRGVRPSAHLCVVFRDSNLEAAEVVATSARVGAEIFGSAWAPGARRLSDADQTSADRIKAAFPSVTVSFVPPLHRRSACDAELADVALGTLWATVLGALRDTRRVPAPSADCVAGVTVELVRRLSSRVESASIEVPAVYEAVLQEEARGVLTRALAPLASLSASDWQRLAAKFYDRSGGGVSSLMQAACSQFVPRPPMLWAPDAQHLVGTLLGPAGVPVVRSWFEAQVSAISKRAGAAAEAERVSRERAAAEAAEVQHRRLLAAQRERLEEERRAAAAAAAARRAAEEARVAAEREAEKKRKVAADAERELEEQRRRERERGGHCGHCRGLDGVCACPYGCTKNGASQCYGGGHAAAAMPGMAVMTPFGPMMLGGQPQRIVMTPYGPVLL